MYRNGLRRWHVVIAAVVIVALAFAAAPAAAASPAPAPALPVALALPQGNTIAPLTTSELHAVNGDGVGIAMYGVRLAINCARNSTCRKTAAKMVVKAVRTVTEIYGGYKLWKETLFD